MRTNVCIFVVIVLCTSATARAVAAASLTPLGILPGGSGSIANGVSDDGSVVVGHTVYNFGEGTEAFRWTPGDGMVGLGYLPGGDRSRANDVSADGSVIVGASNAASGGGAFRWTSGGGMVGLGGGASVANGVSADGSVIIGTGNDEAFRWTSGDGVVGLGTLLQGYGSAANGVSDDGSVIIGSSYSASNGDLEAFRWTSDEGMVGLGGLPGGAFSFQSGANSVSGDGSVVVGWNWLTGWNFPDDYYFYDFEFFRWTEGGGVVGLGTLPGGDQYGGEATGTNFDGSVIVGYNFSHSENSAFVWTSSGGMQPLWDVLVDQGLDPAADGWTSLSAAHDISADGTTIVGSGQRNGHGEAFIAVLNDVSELLSDFDLDNDVDGFDFLKWQRGESPNPLSSEDFALWQANYGAAGSLVAAQTVPEPTGLLLATMLIITVTYRRRPASRPAPYCVRA